MNFKDSISTFTYNLIILHHDIMWYIIIILSIVYWSLYKILKEYSWSNFNKTEGFISVLDLIISLISGSCYLIYYILYIFKILSIISNMKIYIKLYVKFF